MHIKSVINKDKNDYYCQIFLEKWSNRLKKLKNNLNFFHSLIMVRLGERNSKRKVLCCKKTYTNLSCYCE